MEGKDPGLEAAPPFLGSLEVDVQGSYVPSVPV